MSHRKCRAFGIAYHSPEQIVALLQKSRVAKSQDIGIAPTGARIHNIFRVVLFLSVQDFSRNLVELDGSTTAAIVFSNPIDLNAVHGLIPLDFVSYDSFTFQRMDLDIREVSTHKQSEIRRVRDQFLIKLIDSVKHGSLLNPLMTFVYTLSPAKQALVKHAVVEFLYKGLTQRFLHDRLLQHLSNNSLNKLLDVLAAPTTQSYATAMQTIRLMRQQKKDVNIDSVAKATSTAAYELSYMLSVLNGAEGFADSFDKAKNRKIR